MNDVRLVEGPRFGRSTLRYEPYWHHDVSCNEVKSRGTITNCFPNQETVWKASPDGMSDWRYLFRASHASRIKMQKPAREKWTRVPRKLCSSKRYFLACSQYTLVAPSLNSISHASFRGHKISSAAFFSKDPHFRVLISIAKVHFLSLIAVFRYFSPALNSHISALQSKALISDIIVRELFDGSGVSLGATNSQSKKARDREHCEKRKPHTLKSQCMSRGTLCVRSGKAICRAPGISILFCALTHGKSFFSRNRQIFFSLALRTMGVKRHSRRPWSVL